MKPAAVLISILFFGAIGAAAWLYLSQSVETLATDAVPTVSDNVATDPALQSEADALLSLFDNMPPVPVFVSDEIINKTGTNTERGVAYTNCDDLQNPSIVVKREFRDRVNEKQRINILKHELTHAWLCRQRLMNGHDELFRRKFESVGGFGN